MADEENRIDMTSLLQHKWVNDNCPTLQPYKEPSNDELELDAMVLEVSNTSIYVLVCSILGIVMCSVNHVVNCACGHNPGSVSRKDIPN